MIIYNCRAAAKACCINGPMTGLLSPTEVYAVQQDRTPKTVCSCLNAACSCTCRKTAFNGPQHFSRGMKTTKTTLFWMCWFIKKIKIMMQQKEFLWVCLYPQRSSILWNGNNSFLILKDEWPVKITGASTNNSLDCTAYIFLHVLPKLQTATHRPSSKICSAASSKFKWLA